ncbi:MAG: hypothetical protein AAGF87_13575 [Bacteroidota bacterium]
MAEKLPNDSSWSRRLADWESGQQGPHPDPKVWGRLEESLSKRKRRTAPYWRAISGLIILLISAGIFWLQSDLSTENPAHVTSPRNPPTTNAQEPQSVLPAQEPRIVLHDQEPRSVRRRRTFERSPAPAVSSSERSPVLLPTESSPKPPGVSPDLSGPIDETRRSQSVSPIPNLTAKPLLITSALGIHGVSWKEPSPNPVGGIAAENESRGSSSSVRPSSERKRFSVGFQTALHKPEVRVQLPENTRQAQSIVNPSASSWGLRFRLELGDRWGVTSGFSCGRESSEHRLVLVREYTPELETIDADGNARTTFSADFATDYSKAGTEIEVVRPVGVEIPASFFLRMGIRAFEEVKTTSIPLLVSYDQPLGKIFRLRLSGGVAWNRQRVALDIQSRLSNPRGLNLISSRIRSSEQFLDDNFWTSQLQVGLAIRPNSSLEVVLSPQFTSSLSQLGEDRNLSARFQQFSFLGEVYYRF